MSNFISSCDWLNFLRSYDDWLINKVDDSFMSNCHLRLANHKKGRICPSQKLFQMKF